MRLSSFLPIIVAGLLLLPSNVSLFASRPQERPTFKAESELVVLHVSVRDRGGIDTSSASMRRAFGKVRK